MIDWSKTLYYYAKYIKWNLYNSKKSLCVWYQNQCRAYLDEN